MPNATTKDSFQNPSHRDRPVGVLTIIVIILLWLVVKGRHDERVPDLAAATLFVLLAFLNWRAGPHVARSGVVVRNVWRSRRISVSEVKGAVFVRSTRGTDRGIIAVEMARGARVE